MMSGSRSLMAAGTRYEQKRVRRFFALYFIPLIPLEQVAEYIERQGCKNTYRPEVLTHDPAAEQRRFRAACHEAALRVMVRMVAAGGHIADEEVKTVRGVYAELTGQELSADEVAAEAAAVIGGSQNPAADVAQIAAHLNNNGREMVLRSALFVAAADGDVAEGEKQVIYGLAAALGMSPAHMRGVIAEHFASASSSAEDES